MRRAASAAPLRPTAPRQAPTAATAELSDASGRSLGVARPFQVAPVAIGWSHPPSAQETFRGVRVADLMTPEPQVAPPTMPLDAFVYEEVVKRGQRALPVVDGDLLLGIVSVADAQETPPAAWAATPVSAVMTRRDLATVEPEDDLDRALKLMTERGLHQVLVTRGGSLVGLLTRANVVQFLALRAKLGLPPRRPTGGAEHLRRVA